MVIMHHSYLFVIVVYWLPKSLARSAIGFRSSTDRSSVRKGASEKSPRRRRARITYRLIDETSIFQKASAVAAVQIAAAAQYLHRGTYKSEVMGNGSCGSGGNTAKGGDRRWGFALKQGVLSIGCEKRASRTKRTEGRVRHSATQRTRILPRVFRSRLRLYSIAFPGASPEITPFQWDSPRDKRNSRNIPRMAEISINFLNLTRKKSCTTYKMYETYSRKW